MSNFEERILNTTLSIEKHAERGTNLKHYQEENIKYHLGTK